MKRTHRLQPWQRQAMADGYAAGEKEEALAAEFNVSKRTPAMTAKRMGYAVRPNGRPKRAQPGNCEVASES